MFELEDYFLDFFDIPKPVAHELWVEEFESMAIHTRGRNPEKLIGKRRPSEPENILEYRLDVYEPITKDFMKRGIFNLQRILNRASVNYYMPEDLEAYLELNQFQNHNFWAYMSKITIPRMIEDPNGALVWWPIGDGVEQSNETVNVKPCLILSKNIRHLINNEVVSWLSDEKSEVEGNKGKEFSGDVYYVVTRSGYYKYEQYGKKSKNSFQRVDHYVLPEEVDQIPLIILGGVETGQLIGKSNEDTPYWESFFAPSRAFANDAIGSYSDHKGVMVQCAFPMKDVAPQECTNCDDGKIFHKDKDPEICPVCEGDGQVIPNSPFGYIKRPQDNRPGQTDKGYVPSLVYITPPVDIIKESREDWEKSLARAEKALNLLFIDSAQSGRAKEIDREDKISMLDRIGENVVLNLMLNSIININRLRNINSQEGEISASLPYTFHVPTETELSEEVSNLVTKEAPDFLINEATKSLIKRKFGQNRDTSKIAEALMCIDPFFSYNISKKQDLLASGSMSNEAFILSVHAPRILTKMSIEEKEAFRAMDTDAIEAKIRAEIAPLINTQITSPSGEV